MTWYWPRYRGQQEAPGVVAIPCCPRPTRNALQRVKRTWNTAAAGCFAARICRESRLKAFCVPQCGALHDGRGQQGSPNVAGSRVF